MNQPFVHPQGICESSQVGSGTRIWAFAHVLPKAKIGTDCNICDHVFIENDVVIGDRVTIKCGVQLWDGIRIESDVFIGPNVTFTNDKFPRSKQYPEKFATTVVEAGASLGANATILPDITIGAKAMVGAGAVVTRSVPPRAIVVGNPARIVGYVDTPRHALPKSSGIPAKTSVEKLSVRGVTLHHFKAVEDLRGKLSVGHFGTEVPFHPQRYFIVYDVPSKDVRGEHAHRRCHQFLICLQGSLSVIVDDGEQAQEVTLDQPHLGIYLPPMTWGTQYKYSEQATLLVFASDAYDPSDYIRDYQEFKLLAASSR